MITDDDDKARFVVDADDGATIKGALPIPNVGAVSQRTVELSSSTIRKSLSSTLSTIAKALDDVELTGEKYELSDVRFSIAFEATGEVSIVSLAKGSLGSKTGIEVTLRRRSRP